MTTAPNASITDRVRPIAAGETVSAVHFLKDNAVFVLGEEHLLIVDADGGELRLPVHDGGIMASAANESAIITGGDDGKVVLTGADRVPKVIATDARRRWIDQVALAPNGTAAWSLGKNVFTRTPKGEEKTVELASSAGGLAFAPKGFRVAIAQYNGVSLWFPNASAAPEFLDWKGSHLGVSFSADGKFLITMMQDAMLHGWRLADNKHMRMSGYAGKVRSLSWTADGDWLATSGADQVIMWPFQGKDGPMGKAPRMLAPHGARVTAVACHPKQEVALAGYADGLVLMLRLEDGAEILVHSPKETKSPISALAWSARGDRFAFATEDGDAGVVVI
jgi:WD40 repeat protein